MRIKVWAYPGVETPVTPDEPGAGQPDVLDAGDAVEGLGIDRLRRVVWWFQRLPVDEQSENPEIDNSLILFLTWQLATHRLCSPIH
jgi:hypothetical protein